MVVAFYSIVTGQVLQHRTQDDVKGTMCNLPFCLFCLHQDVTKIPPRAASAGNKIRLGHLLDSTPLSLPGVQAFL